MNRQFKQKDMTGVLFTNNDKQNNQPDYTGRIMVNGKEWRIAAWDSTAKSGQPYFSLKISEPQKKQELPYKDVVESLPSDREVDNPVDLNEIPF